MRSEIKTMCKACFECNTSKINRQKPQGLLQDISYLVKTAEGVISEERVAWLSTANTSSAAAQHEAVPERGAEGVPSSAAPRSLSTSRVQRVRVSPAEGGS